MNTELKPVDVGCICGHDWSQPNFGPYECPKCGSENTCSKHLPMWRHFAAEYRPTDADRERLKFITDLMNRHGVPIPPAYATAGGIAAMGDEADDA